MPRGRQTRKLSEEHIRLLQEYRVQRGLSLAELKTAMGLRVGWETVGKALKGEPVWDVSYLYMVQWIDRYLKPAKEEPCPNS